MKDKELYYDLKEIIGFFPVKIDLYKQALMHKSVMKRNEKGKPVNNERLEFLGDAVLDAVVGDIVFKHFPGKREGFLTNTRAKLVQRETLGKLAKEMGVTRLILSSSNSFSHNSYIGGNAFEALVGAIYLDKGYNACMKFVKKRILKKLINIDKVAYKEVNFKSKLLEWTQKNRIEIEFELVEQGRDENSNPTFSYRVKLETVECSTGNGFTKKEAQQHAAKLTLERLKRNKKFADSIFEAKSERTKMEEEPVMNVPDIEEKKEIQEPEVKQNPEDTTEKPRKKRQPRKKKEQESLKQEFDLSDISAREKTKEEIIAEAEKAAFTD